MPNITMKAKDTLNASLAQCFATIGDNRYNIMNAINMEIRIDKTKVEVPILGRTGKGNKSTGWKGTGHATFHFNTSIFRKMIEEYKNTGLDVYFDIQISNEDPTTSVGRQTVIINGINMDSQILAKFDANDNGYLTEDMSFTFEDFSIPESFELIDGMQ